MYKLIMKNNWYFTSFYALQFLFWKHKHNQMQNTTLDLMHELFQLVNFFTVWF